MSAVMDGLWGLGGRRERREVERNARVPLFDGLPDGAVLDVTETGPGVVTEPRVPFRHRPRRRVRPVWADDPAGHLAGTVGYLATETARGVTHPGETVGPFLATSWRGFRRAAVDATTWAWDLEMVATRRRLAHLGHIKDHATTRRAIIDTRKRRVPTWCAGWALLAGLVALAATTVAYGSWPARAACAAAATVVAVACHLNGRRPAPGRPAEPAPAKDTASGVTTDRVVSALEDASQTLKGAQTIGGVVHAGRGQFRHSKIEVSLRGATPSYEAVKVATQVAAYLGKPAGCVFIDQSPSTVEGEVLVTVLAQDPMLGAYVPSPLADPRKTANVWDDGIPLGVNPRGEPIRLQLIENNVLIGGVIGGGKTALLDTLLLGVLLDPLYDVEIWDFKGAGDLQVAEPFAVEYHSIGDDPDIASHLHQHLIELNELCRDRNHRWGKLPAELRRNGVSREVAADPTNGMRPRVVFIEELANALDSSSGTGIREAADELTRTSRSQRIHTVAAMQRTPREDLGSMRSHFTLRIALRVMEPKDSELILGGYHERRIVDASTITPDKKGVGILAGLPTGTTLFRTHEMNPAIAEGLLQKISAVRRPHPPKAAAPAQGVLLVKDSDPMVTPAQRAAAWRAEVRAVFRDGETEVACFELAQRLGRVDGEASPRKVTAAFNAEALKVGGVEPQRARGPWFLTLRQLAER